MNGRCMNPNNPGDGNVTLQERLRGIGRTGYVPAQARLDMLEAADTLDAREAEIARLREAIAHAICWSRGLSHSYDPAMDICGESVPIRTEALWRLYQAIGKPLPEPPRVVDISGFPEIAAALSPQEDR